MGATVVAILVAVASFQADTATFADPGTEELFRRARARHLRQDSIVHDYQATVRTRVEATAGRSRFAKLTTLWAHESVAEVSWQAPNDLKVRVVGTRTKVPMLRLFPELADRDEEIRDQFRGEVLFDRPWFIPRSLGDSIRLMGLPTVAALHPLASDGHKYYRFAVLDSARLRLPGRTVRTARMKVEPKIMGPALVAGQMWLDVETGDVVRMRLLFLGAYLWDHPEDATKQDSVEARELSERVSRYVTLEAELEYVLVNSQYWMPLRQYLGITAEVPMLVNLTIPARAVSTFEDYVVNSGTRFDFVIPEEELEDDGDIEAWGPNAPEGGGAHRQERRDSLGYYRGAQWRDGRWEVEIPPRDSVAAYEWEEEFQTSFSSAEEARLRETVAELAALEDELPAEWTGRPRLALAVEQVADMVRFNRVQGLSVGMGMQFRPKIRHTRVLVAGRIGFADWRPLANVTLRSDGPLGRLDVLAHRELREVDPWTSGLGIGNSLNAVFTAHDDADYYLTTGGGVDWTWNWGVLRDVRVTLKYERHDGVSRASGSAIADLWGTGMFQLNPPVAEGWFGNGQLSWSRRLGPVAIGAGAGVMSDWTLAATRGWAEADVAFRVFNRSGKLSTKVAITRGDPLPQATWRLGGPRTVRGFTYGTRWGREMWAAQLDMALTTGGVIAPVLFVDVGDTFDRDPLVAVGGGVSVLNGLLRFNLSAGVRPSTKLRFDLLFRAPR